MSVNNNGYYSYLNASTGANPAAFRAGYSPKNMPILAEAPTANIIERIETVEGQSASLIIPDMIFANPVPRPNPTRMPIIPPTIHRITASTRN